MWGLWRGSDEMLTVSMERVMANVTMEVRLTGVQRMCMRLWIARQLLWIASLVAGVAFVIIPTVKAEDVAG